MLQTAPKTVTFEASQDRVAYPDAVARMEAQAAAIELARAAGEPLPQLVWFVEHAPLYTAGASAKDGDLLTPDRFPVFQTGRGGQFTYHGPGQRVAYVMLDLTQRNRDVRKYVCDLEEWIIRALARLGIKGERRSGRVGIWVARGSREDKVAAIGVRVRKWVSYHGIAVNVSPDLSHYAGIVPCGISQHGVTSLADLGCTATMADVDAALKAAFEDVFGLALNPVGITA